MQPGEVGKGGLQALRVGCSLAPPPPDDAATDDWYASLRRVHVPPFRGEIDDLIQGQEHEIVPRVDDQWPLADRGGSYGDAGKGILTIRDVKDPGPPESHKCLMGGSEYPFKVVNADAGDEDIRVSLHALNRRLADSLPVLEPSHAASALVSPVEHPIHYGKGAVFCQGNRIVDFLLSFIAPLLKLL